MNEVRHSDILAAARSDRLERSRRHAQQCVLLAVVTPRPLAAELIDSAVALHAGGTTV